MEYLIIRTNEAGKKMMKGFNSAEEAPDYNHVMLTREEWKYFCDQVNEMKSRQNGLNSEIEDLRKMNENMMRICKERANADRKLKPKKLHRGYVLLGLRQQDFYFAKKKYDGVKATIQLPCNTVFRFNDVLKYLDNDNWTDYVFKYIDNPYYCKDGIPYDASDYGVVVYELKLNSNYRSGYWEAELYMDRFIDFPESMKGNDD